MTSVACTDTLISHLHPGCFRPGLNDYKFFYRDKSRAWICIRNLFYIRKQSRNSLIKQSFDLNIVFANQLISCMERPAIYPGITQYFHCLAEARETENGLREDLEIEMTEKNCTGKSHNFKGYRYFSTSFCSGNHWDFEKVSIRSCIRQYSKWFKQPDFNWGRSDSKQSKLLLWNEFENNIYQKVAQNFIAKFVIQILKK